jgi:antibiotic biosynthesis monooxygenase (ABM) superfamily enzyme
MPKVLFMISYGVKPELREQYLQFTSELKAYFAVPGRREYTICEVKGKKNNFTEVFTFPGMEEFDALEEQQNDATQALESKLEQFVDRGGMKYTTLVEVG